MAYLDHLRTFLTIYRVGSISGAAQVLHLTQPSVSNHLKMLEHQIGKPLFVRQARGVRATPTGTHLARRVEPMIDGLETAYRSVRKDSIDLSGIVHIGGPAEFMAARLLPSLSELSHSNIAVRAQFGDVRELLGELKDGGLDLVLATVRIPDKQISYTQVYEEKFYLVGAPKWRQAASSPTELVRRVPLLAYCENLAVVRRYFQTQGMSLDGVAPSLIAPDLRALLACSEAGGGMTVLPHYLCEHALAAGTLVRLYSGKTPPANRLYLAYAKTSSHHPRTVYVRDHLIQAAVEW